MEASIFRVKDLLQIPIILVMVCVLYFKDQKLPRSHTAVAGKIMEMCLDRSPLKHFGRKASEIQGLHGKLYQLGKLAWTIVKSRRRQLL